MFAFSLVSATPFLKCSLAASQSFLRRSSSPASMKVELSVEFTSSAALNSSLAACRGA